MLVRIYYLTHPNIPEIYIGSTRTSLSHRIGSHRASAKAGGTSLIYQTMRDSDPDQWDLILIEEVEVEELSQQKQIEQFWMDQIQPELNENSAYTNKAMYDLKRYHMKRDEVIARQHKHYHSTNKEKVACPTCQKMLLKHSLQRHIRTQH